MASDSLNQVGKYIRKSGKDSDRSLKRAYPIQPRLERVRDVFDSTTEFEMQFETIDNDKRVLLDLNFTLPPPARGCKAGCIISQCERFEFALGGNHSITLEHPYLATSVSVFVNGNRLPDYQVNELSPDSGEVFYQGTEGPDVVAICYVYSTCGTGDGTFIHCPAFSSTLGLTTVLFSDRFDRIPNPQPYGGVGYWVTNDTLVAALNTPVSLFHNAGETPLVTPDGTGDSYDGIHYVFENIRGNGNLFEVILAMDFNSLSGTFVYALTGSAVSLQVSSTGQVLIYSGITYQTILSDSVSYTQVYSTFQTPINVKQKVYIRFLHDGTNYKFRIWPMNEPEPDWWFQHSPQLITTPSFLAQIEWQSIGVWDHIGADLTGDGMLLGIQHWGGNVNGDSLWNYGGEIGNSWSRNVCYSQSDAGIPAGQYFGVCASTTKSLSEFSTYANADTVVSVHTTSNMRQVVPTFQYKYTWDQFFPDQAYYYGLNQTVVSFMYDYGKGLNAKISGEVRWVKNGSTSLTPASLAIALMAFGYGGGTPSGGADYLAGTSINVVHGAVGEWVQFSCDVPVVEGHIQWGARITDEPVALADQLGDHTGTLFLPRTAELTLQFRRLKIESTMAPLGNAKPFCPDSGSLLSRCPQTQDNFTGPLSIANTCDIIDTTYTASNGQVWTLDSGYAGGVSVDVNGSLRFDFQAHGLTTDGSDGRCPRQTGRFVGDRSQTFVGVDAYIDSPVNCGYATASMQIRFGPVPPYYTINNTAEGWEGDLGTQDASIGTLNIGNWLSITKSDEPIFNRIQSGVVNTDNFMISNEWYNLYIESTNTLKFKLWKSSDPEPLEWFGQPPNNLGAEVPIDPTDQFMGFTANYGTFVDDNFYIEIAGLQITPIEPRIEGPNV